MADITSNVTIRDRIQNDGLRAIDVSTLTTADTADTFTVDLSDYGATTIRGILGFVENTEGSVVVQEQPTTSVTGTTLTVTVGGSTVSNKRRNYIIYVA